MQARSISLSVVYIVQFGVLCLIPFVGPMIALIILYKFPVATPLRYGSYSVIIVELVVIQTFSLLITIPVFIDLGMGLLVPIVVWSSLGLVLLASLTDLVMIILIARYVWRRVHLPPIHA